MKTIVKNPIHLQVEELEERIAPDGVKGGYGDNPHDAPPGQGNWGAGTGNSGNGDQHGNNDQGGGGQPGGNPGVGDDK
jgi:hypothetical protein